MITLEVQDMTCGGCAGKVGRAIKAVDDEATFEIDLAQRTVLVSSTASVADICTTLAEAGFPAKHRD